MQVRLTKGAAKGKVRNYPPALAEKMVKKGYALLDGDEEPVKKVKTRKKK